MAMKSNQSVRFILNRQVEKNEKTNGKGFCEANEWNAFGLRSLEMNRVDDKEFRFFIYVCALVVGI